jgi:hypothetical protein
MAIEYPTRVHQLEKATGDYKEKYVYDENNSTWNEIGVASSGMVDESQCDKNAADDAHLMGLVEIFEQDSVLGGERQERSPMLIWSPIEPRSCRKGCRLIWQKCGSGTLETRTRQRCKSTTDSSRW